METKLTDEYLLKSLFYNVYDIDSGGVMAQTLLVDTLVSGVQIPYETGENTLSIRLCANKANLYANPIVAGALDPKYAESMSFIFPVHYFGEDEERLRQMKSDLDRLAVMGRYEALQAIVHHNFGSGPLDECEIEEVTNALNALGSARGLEPLKKDNVERFLGDEYLKEFQPDVHQYWNGGGRKERVQYHTSKLELMNAITGAAIKKAKLVGIDPDTLARNDAEHALYWKQVYDEDVPLPGVLLARAQNAVADAFEKYPRGR
ncbi:MAG: hypothetical protein HYT71_02560 [Candidatus Aenigmarchaeota archaeon]|nr:hypothetical protein [Candidatus Aenigmarchaeota archaeon]